MFLLDASKVGQLGAQAAQYAKSLIELEQSKGSRKPEDGASTQQKDRAANTQKAAPPQPQVLSEAERYHAAIVRTIDAGGKVARDVREVQYQADRDAARQSTDQQGQRVRQTYQMASTASTHAVRQGLSAAVAREVANNARNKYSGNENFDQDAVEAAAIIIEDFMGGLV